MCFEEYTPLKTHCYLQNRKWSFKWGFKSVVCRKIWSYVVLSFWRVQTHYLSKHEQKWITTWSEMGVKYAWNSGSMKFFLLWNISYLDYIQFRLNLCLARFKNKMKSLFFLVLLFCLVFVNARQRKGQKKEIGSEKSNREGKCKSYFNLIICCEISNFFVIHS